MAVADPIVDVRRLKKYFPIRTGLWQRTTGYVKAVNGISFTVRKGETLGLVGESGCGKSTAGRTMIRLYKPTEGQIIYKGKDIAHLPESELRTSVRREIQMIFQDPFASLNPRKTLGTILEEPLKVHRQFSTKERQERVVHLLEKVGLKRESIHHYPHEFSGGQRQRVGIARAMVLNPSFIIADEPVSALDVSVQAQVINLLKDLQEEYELTYLFISHDLGVIRHVADRVGVMYLGQMMELADKKKIYATPLHPYTQSLMSAIPRVGRHKQRERIILRGEVPSPSDPPQGCVFHTRCPQAFADCKHVRPQLKAYQPGHYVACHLYH